MSEYKLRIVVRGLFFNKKDEVLLIKSVDGERWALPGGGMEENESLAEAVERKLRVETGFSGKADKIIFVQEFIKPSGTKQLEIFFNGKITEEKQSKTANHQAQFFNPKSFNSIQFHPKSLNPFSLKGSIDYHPRFSKTPINE